MILQDWRSFYSRFFLNDLDKMNHFRRQYFDINSDILPDDKNLEKLCLLYYTLFNSACFLLQCYLAYNGLIQYEQRAVIKEAFYVELIQDGETWIKALSLCEIIKVHGAEKLKSVIVKSLNDEYFKIFDDLKFVFSKKLEEYE
ncbi:MAG: hypothetical protein KHX03_01525 [Clostridium sp.]|nr:hypothetical protein [Clostridium sp.]